MNGTSVSLVLILALLSTEAFGVESAPPEGDKLRATIAELINAPHGFTWASGERIQSLHQEVMAKPDAYISAVVEMLAEMPLSTANVAARNENLVTIAMELDKPDVRKAVAAKFRQLQVDRSGGEGRIHRDVLQRHIINQFAEKGGLELAQVIVDMPSLHLGVAEKQLLSGYLSELRKANRLNQDELDVLSNKVKAASAQAPVERVSEEATTFAIDMSSDIRLLESMACAMEGKNYSMFRACLGGEAVNEYPPTDKNNKRYNAEALQQAKDEYAMRCEGVSLKSLELKRNETRKPTGVLRFTKGKGNVQKMLAVTLTLSKTEMGWRATIVSVEERDAPEKKIP